MSAPIVGVDGYTMPLSEALKLCLQLRNAALIRARQYRHDMAWFEAHDPAEYEMQVLKDPVSIEIQRARRYHHKALAYRRIDRAIPKQGVLL